MTTQLPAIVSAEWLLANLNDPNLIVIDASLENAVSAKTQAVEIKIPRAKLLDIGTSFYDRDTELPHMLPSPRQFETEAGDLGVSNLNTLIVYDSRGIYSSPRVRWMFKVMGHKNVAVLDGGLPAWIEKRYPVEQRSEETEYKRAKSHRATYVADYQRSLVVAAHEIPALLASKESVLIDARSSERFHGRAPEPRKELRSGNIEGSQNLPFQEVLSGPFLNDVAALTALFRIFAGRDKRLVFSCGSGVTACIPALGAEVAGYRSISIYDGSWSEWGRR